MSNHTVVMGILNVTSDSFYDGGRYIDVEDAYRRAMEIEEAGADIIDIGGESTRPGAYAVDEKTELSRVLPVLERLKGSVSIPISIDTSKAEVARRALELGVKMVNDISGLRNDPDMAEVAADYNVPVVIMHMKGAPRSMQDEPFYLDVIGEIKDFFRERIKWAVRRGIKEENIILDPGIGFGKRCEDNLSILRNLFEFKEFRMPILVGPSRKSFIGQILSKDAESRLMGTSASVAVAVMNGADMLRVHDVKEMREVVQVVEAIEGCSKPGVFQQSQFQCFLNNHSFSANNETKSVKLKTQNQNLKPKTLKGKNEF